jgi:lipoprotein NlpI
MYARSLLFLATIIVAICPLAGAQEDSGDDAEYLKRLEDALVELNGLIKDEPSRYHHNRAEVFFRLGRFEESVKNYDEAAKFGRPHDDDWCWERGLAQYYAGDFQAGAEQFTRYHKVGALDIENGLWRLMCMAEDDGIEKARASMLEYSRRVRVPFPALLELYMGRGEANAVVKQATDGVTDAQQLTANLFNAHYYLAKYYELVGEMDKADEHVRESLKHPFPHFMYACAQIDAKRIAAKKSSTR